MTKLSNTDIVTQFCNVFNGLFAHHFVENHSTWIESNNI